MRAATIRDGQIAVEEHPDPTPQTGELLVRVRSAGLNGADMMQLAGRYPAPPGAPQDIPGLELAGGSSPPATASSASRRATA
jgi:NADPH2:quinone reductase